MDLREIITSKDAAQKFEEKINPDLDILYAKITTKPEYIRQLRDHHIQLNEFIKLYENQNEYSLERLPFLITLLMDIKFQIALFDEHICLHFTAHDSPLQRHSLYQDTILKSKIVAERMMNFIYFLETGEDIEKKYSNKKSKQKIFWRLIDQNSKWKFFMKYQETINEHDSLFRTGEAHRCSPLRAWYMGGNEPDYNKLYKLINELRNSFWVQLRSIIAERSGHTI